MFLKYSKTFSPDYKQDTSKFMEEKTRSRWGITSINSGESGLQQAASERCPAPEKISNWKIFTWKIMHEKPEGFVVSVVLGGQSNFTAGESSAVTTLQRFIDSLAALPAGCTFSMCKSLCGAVWASAFGFDFETPFSYSVTKQVLQTNRSFCHRTN